MTEPTCKTCRWWVIDEIGDRMNDHRFWRVPSQVSGTGSGRTWTGSAIIDSFGREETEASHSCKAFDHASDHPPYEHQPKEKKDE